MGDIPLVYGILAASSFILLTVSPLSIGKRRDEHPFHPCSSSLGSLMSCAGAMTRLLGRTANMALCLTFSGLSNSAIPSC